LHLKARAGILRKPRTKDQYSNVMFRRCCRKIAKEIVDRIQEYVKSGTKTKIVIGVDGSPSCGVNRISTGKTCKSMAEQGRVKGSGILIEELHLALTKKNSSIPFHGIRYERLPGDLARALQWEECSKTNWRLDMLFSSFVFPRPLFKLF
jgi:predicted secreted protein